MRIVVVTAAICLSIVGVSVTDDVKAAVRKPTDIPAEQARADAIAAEHDQEGAQEQQATDVQEDKLQEVVVTSRKRQENLQEVPISVQVVSGQTLAEENHNSLQELVATVPGVHISSGGPTSDIFIRGIGSGNSASFDQSVATFVDDIYHGRSLMSGTTFLDLDRIEILKGPQTSFFGNNAIAGALNIVTRKPGNTFDAWSRALYGRYGEYTLEGAVGGPVTDIFGARLAITRNGISEGWIDDVNLHRHVPRTNNLAGRLTLALEPGEDVNATLKIEGSQNRVSGSAFDYPNQFTSDCPPPAPLAADIAGGQCALALAAGLPIGLGQNKNSSPAGLGSSISTFESVLTINYDHWGHTFTSVTGFDSYHHNSIFDGFETGEYLVTGQAPEKYHQFSEELRAISPTGHTFEYLAGIYFQADELAFDFESNNPLINSLAANAPFNGLATHLPLANSTGAVQSEHVYSGFASVTWHLIDALTWSADLRGSAVHKNSTVTHVLGTGTERYGGFVPMPTDSGSCGFATGCQSLAGLLFGTPFSVPIRHSDHALMPSTKIQYQIKPDAMVYFSYARGFKAGGVNGGVGTRGVVADLEFGPEYVNAYELGLKSKWFDDRVLVDVSLFRSDYSDLQVSNIVPDPATSQFFSLVRNAASSRAQGVELEGQWVVSKEFRIATDIAYLDGRYVSYPNAGSKVLQPPSGPAFQDLSGRPTMYSPKWSGSVTASYSASLFGGYKLTTELSPYFSSSYYVLPSDESFFQQSSYARLDARVTLEKPDGHWAVDVLGKNLTDTIIIHSHLGGPFVAAKEPFRVVSAQVRFRW